MFTLFMRVGCHLCEDARALLEARGVPFVERDVTGSYELEAAYGWEIPVLVDARGEVVLKGRFDAAGVARVPLER